MIWNIFFTSIYSKFIDVPCWIMYMCLCLASDADTEPPPPSSSSSTYYYVAHIHTPSKNPIKQYVLCKYPEENFRYSQHCLQKNEGFETETFSPLHEMKNLESITHAKSVFVSIVFLHCNSAYVSKWSHMLHHLICNLWTIPCGMQQTKEKVFSNAFEINRRTTNTQKRYEEGKTQRICHFMWSLNKVFRCVFRTRTTSIQSHSMWWWWAFDFFQQIKCALEIYFQSKNACTCFAKLSKLLLNEVE